MSYNCGDCGDKEHACTGWDGNGNSAGADYQEGENHSLPIGSHFPNHNLIPKCPAVIRCEYRLKKTPSHPVVV